MIILALDALDLTQVQRFKCNNLMQREHGHTDLSDFNQLRTVALWASFLTGKNMEKEIPVETQWEYKLLPQQTLTKFFKTHIAIDVPALTYKQQNHQEERELLKGYFDDKVTIGEHDDTIWKNHQENREDFFKAIGKYDLVIGYFNLADAIGHLSFGITKKMEKVYNELDEMAEKINDTNTLLLILSDHGMKTVGRYGDHSPNGFYSTNHKLKLNTPKITSFYNSIRRITKDEQT